MGKHTRLTFLMLSYVSPSHPALIYILAGAACLLCVVCVSFPPAALVHIPADAAYLLCVVCFVFADGSGSHAG